MMAILFCMNAITKAQVDNPYALVFDTTRGIMYCSTNRFGIFRSTDDGYSWTKWNTGLDTGGIMFATTLAYVSGKPDRVLASASVSGGGTYLMERGTADSTWRRIQTPDGWEMVNSFTVSDSMVWLCGDGGLWLYNSAQRFFENRTPNQDVMMTHLRISPSIRSLVWSGSAYINAGFWNRVNKSTDGGITWTRIRDSVRGLLKGLYINPNNPDHVIVADKIFRETFDGGANWQNSSAPDTITAWISKTTLDWINNRWYSATASDSIYMSSDQGATWKALPLAGGSFITDIILHPKNPCHIFVLKVNGLHESTDCGQTWRRNPFTLSASNQAGMPYGFEIEACYPNPLLVSQSEFYVRIRSERSSKIQFEIFDVLGRMRTASRLELHPNQPQTISLPTSSLEAGTFFLIANDGMSRRLLPLTVLR